MNDSIQRRLLALLLVISALLGNAANAAPSEDIVYYHNDILGNPLAATDESGNVIWQESYTAFGEKTIKDEASNNNPLAFTGHYQDRESGLTYMKGRYYSPELGRFLSPDPANFSSQLEENPLFFNRYVYANNNPYTYVDPDGRYATAALGAVFGAITLYETYQTYQNEGAGAAAKSLLIGAVMSATGLGALKVAGKGLKWAKSKIPAGSGPKGISPPIDVAKKTANLCFVAGTKIKTPDGEKHIEDIEAGDSVYAYDQETNELVVRTVTDTYHNWTEDLVDIRIDGEVITSTPSHKYWLPEIEKWVAAKDLTVDTKLLKTDGSASIINSVDFRKGLTDVFNFEVEGEHNYFVGEQGVLVHNGPGGASEADFNQARNVALEWLEQRGFKAHSPKIGKFGPSAGQPIGMQSADGKAHFRIEFDERNGAHINVQSGKEKGPHFKFKGDQKTVNNIVKRFMCK